MGEIGIIGPEERVELLDGELITMPPIGPDHVAGVDVLGRFLQRTIGERAWISVGGAITLDPISEPQPDIMVTGSRDEKQRWTALPTPDDALLVVEVAKSSLPIDRGKKLRAYARCHVREYWIVDLVHECIEVYRNPNRGRYADHHTVKRGQTLAPEAFPDAVLAAEQILPPER